MAEEKSKLVQIKDTVCSVYTNPFRRKIALNLFWFGTGVLVAKDCGEIFEMLMAE